MAARRQAQSLDLELADVVGDAVFIETLTEQHVTSWINWRRQQKVGGAPKTIANRHGLLHPIMGSAVRRGLRRDKPCEGHRLPRRDADDTEEVKVFLDEAQWRLLHDAMDPDSRDFITVLVGTGLRFSELTALQPRDLDLDVRHGPHLRVDRAWKQIGDDPRALPRKAQLHSNGLLYLGAPKSRKGRRRISLSRPVADILRRVAYGKLPTVFLFTAPAGGEIDPAHFARDRWDKAVATAVANGLTCRPRIHDLRHSHAAWLISSNVPLPTAIDRNIENEATRGTSNRTLKIGVLKSGPRRRRDMRRAETSLAVLAGAMAIVACTPAHHATSASRVPNTSSPTSAAYSAPSPTTALSTSSPGPSASPPPTAPETSASRPQPLAPVAVVSATARVVDRAHAGTSEQRAARVSAGFGHTYVITNRDDNTPYHPYGISELRRVTRSGTAARLDLDGTLSDPLFAYGSLWLVRGASSRPEDFPHSLDMVRVDPVTLKVTGSVPVARPYAIIAAAHAIWVARNNSTLLRVDATTMKATLARKFFTPLAALGYDGAHLWTLQYPSDMGTRSRLLELDPTTMRVLVAITLPGEGGNLTASPTRVVVTVDTSPHMLAFDSATHRQVWSRDVQDVRALTAGGGGSVWYLTGPGRVGHLDAAGIPAGREVDVHRVDPYDMTATPTGPRITFPGGYLDLRPWRMQ